MVLLLSLKMKPQHGFIHQPCEKKYLIHRFCFGNAAQFMLQGNGNFCFSKFFLRFR